MWAIGSGSDYGYYPILGSLGLFLIAIPPYVDRPSEFVTVPARIGGTFFNVVHKSFCTGHFVTDSLKVLHVVVILV